MADAVELDALWDFGDPAASEERFRAFVERARADDEPILAEALTQLARAQGLQRRFDHADSTLDEAEAALRPDDVRGRIRLDLERGRVANTAGRPGRGAEPFRRAWELARAASEDGLAVDAAHMLGIVEPRDDAWAWNERAMELARTSADPVARRWVGSLANNMGWALHDAGEVDAAIALFERSRDAFLEDGRDDRARIARWSIARCLRSRGDLQPALAVQEELLAELDALGETDGYVFEEIAECLLALGRDDEARPYFARAWEELRVDPNLSVDEPERLERLRALGE
jgi:tetratricopeptide (TPR) repeat protein